jgi:hypothetical protein
MPGRIQLAVAEPPSPLLHNILVEAATSVPQIREWMSPNEDGSLTLRRPEAMESIQSNSWEKAVRRIKSVMDALGPVAEVCAIV